MYSSEEQKTTESVISKMNQINKQNANENLHGDDDEKRPSSNDHSERYAQLVGTDFFRLQNPKCRCFSSTLASTKRVYGIFH